MSQRGYDSATEYMIEYFNDKRDAALNKRKTRWFAGHDQISSYNDLVDLENGIFNSKMENDELIAARHVPNKLNSVIAALGEKLSYVATLRHAIRTQFVVGAAPYPRRQCDVRRFIAAASNAAAYALKLFMLAIALKLDEGGEK